MQSQTVVYATVRAGTPGFAPRAHSRMVPPCSGLSCGPKLAPTQLKNLRRWRAPLPPAAATSNSGDVSGHLEPEGASFDGSDAAASPSSSQPLDMSLGFSPNTGVIRGSSFIIKRSGASAAPAASALVPVPPGGLQMHPSFGVGGPMVPYDLTRTMVLVDDTTVSLVGEEGTSSAAVEGAVLRTIEEHEVEVLLPGEDKDKAGGSDDGVTFPPTSCTGIVPVPSEGLAGYAGQYQGADSGEEGPIDSSSPRRTHRLRFTCNMCGSVNTKPINPHAWASGTVFARCCGCGIVHRLIDHLNVVDEIVYGNEEGMEPPLGKASASPQGQPPGTATAPSSDRGIGSPSAGPPPGYPPLPMVVGDLLVPEELNIPEPEDPRLN